MAEFNLPPFYIGQKVVALITDELYGSIKKGEIYSVMVIKKFCTCGHWAVDIGERIDMEFCGCGECGYKEKSFGVSWIWAGHFAPVLENFQAISFEKVIEEETALVGAN